MKKMFLIPTLVLLLLTASVHAQQTDVAGGLSPEVERARIQADRNGVEARFAKDEAACYQKFAVTGCLGEARLVRREAMADLRRQEASLGAAEAKRRGASQLSRIEERSSPPTQIDEANRRAEALDRQQQRQDSAEEKAAAKAEASQKPGALADVEKDRAQRRAKSISERAAKANSAAVEQKRYAGKLKEAQAEKAQRLKRQAEQAKSSATPLATPP